MTTLQPRPNVALASRLPVTEAGGIESAVREMARHLATRNPQWNVRCVHAFRRRTALNAIPYFGDLVAALLIARRCRGANAIVVNGGEYAWPLLFTKRGRDSTIVVWHGTRAGEIPALRPRLSVAVRVYLWLEVQLQRRALRAHGQIAVSRTTIAELRTAYGHALVPAISLVPNGAPAIDCGAIRAVPFRVAWVGTTAYKKGLDIAIGACRLARSRLPQLRLAVIGLDKRGISASDSWIDYVGRLDHPATLAELRRCNVLLGTSRYEGCSVAIIEALAIGLPVVAGPSVAWMIGEGGIKVSDFAPASFARALERLLGDPVRLNQCAASTEEAARAFDWSEAAEAYGIEIERCLERHFPRAGGTR